MILLSSRVWLLRKSAGRDVLLLEFNCYPISFRGPILSLYENVFEFLNLKFFLISQSLMNPEILFICLVTEEPRKIHKFNDKQ